MSEPVSPLDGPLLDALRTERPAPRDVRARVRTKLEAAIPEMRRGPGGGGNGGSANGGAGRGFGAFGSPTMSIAAFVVGGVSGAALFASLAGAPPARIVYVDRPAPETVAPGSTLLRATAAFQATATPSAMPDPPRPASASPATVAQPAAVRSPPAAQASRLTEERILLDQARARLIQGAPERALERLVLHRTRFADGLLAEERDAMQVEALAGAGRYEEARERANSFRARLPGSLFLPTVESAIASIP